MALSRRTFLQKTALASAFPLSMLSDQTANGIVKKMKCICIGGHPDDPESGCGGTLAKLAAAGHTVKVAYLTRGEAGIEGKSHSEAAAIRTKEAMAACVILGVAAEFLGQIDGDTTLNKEWRQKIKTFLQNEQPDIVFTHWPMDTHPDHVAASTLTFDAWNALGRSFQLYYFEVCTGEQTIGFHPTDYVDITATQPQKIKAIECHISQDPPGIFACGHRIMDEFRGRESGVKAAEAFAAVQRLSW